MKAVVMAGGQGTRLRPLTSNQPKPMVPVVNKPSIQHILELVQRHGINEVVMTLAFLPRLIRNHFGDGSSLGMHIDYTVEETPAGTAGSIRLAKDLLDETFLVISGDALTDFDLTKVVDFHKEREAMVTIALKSVENPLEFGVVIVDDEGRIQRFLEKPGWGQVFSDTVNTGIYVLEPEVFDHIPEGQPYDFSHDLFPKLFDMQQAALRHGLRGLLAGHRQPRAVRPGQPRRARRQGARSLRPACGCAATSGWARAPRSRAWTTWKARRSSARTSASTRGRASCRTPSWATTRWCGPAPRSAAPSWARTSTWLPGPWSPAPCSWNAVEVHENAHIAEGAVVGDRSIVGRNAVVANNVKIYPFKNIEPGSAVRSSIVWETRGAEHAVRPQRRARPGQRGRHPRDGHAPGHVLRHAHQPRAPTSPPAATPTTPAACSSGPSSAASTPPASTCATSPRRRWPSTASTSRAATPSGGIHVQMSLDNPELIEILFSEAPGVPLDGKRERAIENHYFREDFRRAAFEEMGQVVYPPRVIETYTNSLLENWNTVAIRGRQPRLVLDYSLSAPAFFFPTTLDKLGVETIALNTFSRSRSRFTLEESLPAAAARVGEMVRAMEADLGADPRSGSRVPLRGRREGPARPRFRAAAPAAAARRPRRGPGRGGPAPPRHPAGRAGGRLHRGEHPPHPVLQGRRHGRGHPAQHGLRRHHRRRLHLPVGAALHGRASTRWARCWS